MAASGNDAAFLLLRHFAGEGARATKEALVVKHCCTQTPFQVSGFKFQVAGSGGQWIVVSGNLGRSIGTRARAPATAHPSAQLTGREGGAPGSALSSVVDVCSNLL